MKLVADEGVDKPIVDYLRALGHEIIYILEIAPSITDEQVLSIALKEQAILMTMDTDFGELVYRLKEATYGVLLLRLAGFDIKQKQRITASVLQNHAEEMKGCFSVVNKDTLRIRKL